VFGSSAKGTTLELVKTTLAVSPLASGLIGVIITAFEVTSQVLNFVDECYYPSDKMLQLRPVNANEVPADLNES
jgi:hypothetical protein